MKTTIITVDEAIKKGANWTDEAKENACDFHGYMPGYVMGFNLEVIRDGKYGYGSCVYTNDYQEILNPDYCENWNELGLSESCCALNDYRATGNIVFRGYFTEHYDPVEREEYVKKASEEVEALWHKYVS